MTAIAVKFLWSSGKNVLPAFSCYFCGQFSPHLLFPPLSTRLPFLPAVIGYSTRRSRNGLLSIRIRLWWNHELDRASLTRRRWIKLPHTRFREGNTEFNAIIAPVSRVSRLRLNTPVCSKTRGIMTRSRNRSQAEADSLRSGGATSDETADD